MSPDYRSRTDAYLLEERYWGCPPLVFRVYSHAAQGPEDDGGLRRTEHCSGIHSGAT